MLTIASAIAVRWQLIVQKSVAFFADAAVFLILELTSAQIQEGIGEAINNIIKHFHKPEKEVSEFQHIKYKILFYN